MQVKTASIVGARGYSGQELARLLLNHPAVKLNYAFATQAFDLSAEIFDDRAKAVKCLSDDQLFSNVTDIVFLATPAEVSMNLAPKLMDKGAFVIDLSGAFRLKAADISKWYGFEHTARLQLAAADYGLAPFCGPLPKNVQLVANPGCYATSISMALIPLLKRGLIETESLVIDAKSGTTGAGRKAVETQLFAEVTGECLPYRVGKHQHLPEIQEAVAQFSSKTIDPHFNTHLLPVKRGIIASIYAKTSAKSLDQIEAAYAEEFANYKLVRFGRDISRLAKLGPVQHTPYTHISYELIGNKLYVFSVIDNLMKGAASQAVENLNRSLDLPLSFTLVGEN
jgi:N-acetyl-gamma-glutamyl-phosphate reductase